MTAIPVELMERLAFVRSLYLLGIEHAAQPEPANVVAVLLYHDSVDLFLQLVAEHVGVVTKPKHLPAMVDYFPLIGDKRGASAPPLSQQRAMERLNNVRNYLKHGGTRPARAEVDAFRASVTDFFEANVPLVFGIDFDGISMARHVEALDARSHLERAEQLAAAGDRDGAVQASATAFAYLLRAHGVGRPGESMYFATSKLDHLRYAKDFDVKDLTQVVRYLRDAVEALQAKVAHLSLGVEPAAMARFRRVTPNVSIAMAGNARMTGGTAPGSVTDDDVRFCYNFVIGVALTLQRGSLHQSRS